MPFNHIVGTDYCGSFALPLVLCFGLSCASYELSLSQIYKFSNSSSHILSSPKKSVSHLEQSHSRLIILQSFPSSSELTFTSDSFATFAHSRFNFEKLNLYLASYLSSQSKKTPCLRSWSPSLLCQPPDHNTKWGVT